jgi:hypothetical protein
MTPYEYLKRMIDILRAAPTNKCVEWPFGRQTNGYGHVYADGKNQLVARVAFALHYGHMPTQMALHTCDNRPCINPLHLYDGTAKQNTADCIARGRFNSWPLQDRLTGHNISLTTVIACYGLSRSALAKAARTGRLAATRLGARLWVTTAADVEAAIAAGTLRPRQKE